MAVDGYQQGTRNAWSWKQIPISTAPADEPAMIDRRALGWEVESYSACLPELASGRRLPWTSAWYHLELPFLFRRAVKGKDGAICIGKREVG